MDRSHTVRYLNKAARTRYGDIVKVGGSIFSCHNERAKVKIEEFLARASVLSYFCEYEFAKVP